jgi:hypothetical protein
MPVWLKDVSFDFEKDEKSHLGGHLSYTTKYTGGAASGLNSPLLLKSEDIRMTKESLDLLKATKEIRIEMSMEDFLRKIMGMYYEEAAMLAKLLGYSSTIDEENEVTSYQEIIEEKLDSITILKSLKSEEDFYKLNYKDQLKVISTQEDFEKALSEGDSSDRNKNQETKVSKSKNDLDGEDMSEEKYDDLVKSVESLEKALKLEKEAREALERKEQERIEKAFIAKAKEYSFIENEKAEEFGKILKSLKDEDSLTILEILEKAKQKLEDSDKEMFSQTSVSGQAEDSEEISKSKKATREALKKSLGIKEGE